MEDETHVKGTMAEIAQKAEDDSVRESVSSEADREVVENHEVDVLEFGLDERGIDELIESLNELREHREHVSFAIDADNDLVIHFEEATGEDEEVDYVEMGDETEGASADASATPSGVSEEVR